MMGAERPVFDFSVVRSCAREGFDQELARLRSWRDDSASFGFDLSVAVDNW